MMVRHRETDPGTAPGAGDAVRSGCLCSPLLNTHGDGLREHPCDVAVSIAWLIDPRCPLHAAPGSQSRDAR